MTTSPSALVGDACRLAALAGYDILDTPAEPGFDDVVHLACQLCDTPVSLVSLVAGERQWFKARQNFPRCETDLDSSVCAHALARPDRVLMIPDLTVDPRTSANPLVTGEPFIRFYAGAPLVTPDEDVLGTLCVIDTVPRPGGLTGRQVDDLTRLARQVMTLLELRRAVALRDVARAEEFQAYRTREALRDTHATLATMDADLAGILGVVVEGAMRAVPAAEGGVVELIDGDELRYTAVRGTLSAEEGMRLRLTGTLAGHVATSRTPTRMVDAGADPHVRRDLLDRLRLRSAVVTPLSRGTTVLGVLKLQSARVDAFTDRDLETVVAFADAATSGFAKAEARRALEARDAYWRGVFEQLVEGMLVGEVVRDDAGRIVDWRYLDVNAAWERMVGVPRAQALGRTLREIIPGVEDEWVHDFGRVVETGVPHGFSRQVGVWARWYEGNVFRLVGDRFAVTFLDITDRVRAEARWDALVRLGDVQRDVDDPVQIAYAAAELLGRTLDASRVGYGRIDHAAETRTVERDWTAPGVDTLVGTLRLRDYGSYVDALKRGERVVIDDVYQDGRTADQAPLLQARDARSFVNAPVVERGRLVATLSVNCSRVREWSEGDLRLIQDFADRTHVAVERARGERAAMDAAEALRELNATLERQVAQRSAELARVWHNAQDLQVVIDADGVFRAVSPSATRLLGWSPEEMVGQDLFAFTHPDSHRDSRDALMQATREALPTHRNRYRHKDGTDRWLEWVTTPEAGLIYCYGRDITLEVEQAQSLLQTEDALRQAQKMEAVGQLTGGVAHDFNNLLTVIKSSTDLLKRPNLADERRARYVAAISDTVDRAAKLTGQLLAFARRQALKPEVFAACDSVRALSDMVGTLTGSRIAVATDLPEHPTYVEVDPSQFDTALVNLAVNARDAMDGEGRITIAVRAVDAVPAMRTHPDRDGTYVAVSLSDTGSGMSADIVQRIFEPFFTTKGVGKGTGLGLSQVFGFAKQSGGDVAVASVVGEGTTFTLYLPRVAAPAPAAAVEVSEALTDGHGTRVLVVEDNVDVGTFTVQSLTDLGHVTTLATDGPAALEELARDATRFDVVFSDVVMPGMDGIELGQEIRRLYHDLPVVLTSGYSHVLAQNGTHGFELLHKPYSVEQLSQVLHKTAVWRRRRRLVVQ